MTLLLPSRTLWLFLVSILFSMVVHAGETLRVLAWPGYADPDLVKTFEQRTGAKVEVTLIDTDDALWLKASGHEGKDFDVFAVNTAELQRYIRQGLVVPVDTAAIPNLASQLPRFRKLNAIPGIMHNGAVFAIPYTYSDMGLIYDRKQVKEPPQSIQALWDPKYREKVLAYNGSTHNFSLAALSLGSSNPFRIDDKDWPAMVKRLIELRRNVLAFYSDPAESVTLFVSHKAALMFANYGSQQLQLLQKAGADVGYTVPKEGALAWLDCWAITRGVRNKALAEAWINYMLEKGPSDALINRQGLANTITPSPYSRQADRLIWLQPVDNAERRTRLWERVLSGDRLEKVMAP